MVGRGKKVEKRNASVCVSVYLTALSPTAMTSEEFLSVMKLFTIALQYRKHTHIQHRKKMIFRTSFLYSRFKSDYAGAGSAIKK